MPDIELDLELDETAIAPTASVERTEDGAIITCTDVYGTTTATVYDGEKGDPGTSAGFGTPTATIDGGVGTPSVEVTASGSDTAKVFAFAFHDLKGEQGVQGETGETGAAAGFGTPTASVDSNVGTPSVTVTASGQDTAKVFDFAFHNLKGDKGDTGDPATPGSIGTTELADGAVTQAKLADSLESALAFSFGAYSELAAGNVTGEAVDESYLFHASSDAKGSVAEIDSIKGRTLVWNQLIKNGNFANIDGWYFPSQVEGTAENNILTVVAETSTYMSTNLIQANKFYCVANHKYLIAATVSSTAGKVNLLPTGLTAGGNVATTTATSRTRLAGIVTPTEAAEWQMAIRFTASVSGTSEEITATVENYICIDLTQMFGAGNEPSTVAEFEALYPLPYYPYNAGTLKPVNMQGIETVGFNQWDEQWEAGKIDSTTGENVAGTTRIRSKNYIPVFPNTQYYIKQAAATDGFFAAFYDAGKTYISGSWINTASATYNPITTPSNCHYMRFTTGDAYGGVYKHDICINISGARNGEYEPYWSSQLAIPAATYFPNGMRSAGTAHDALYRDHADTVIGAVDLGTLEWQTESTNQSGVYRMRTVSVFSNVAKPSVNSTAANIECAKYDITNASATYTTTSGIAVDTSGYIYVYDPNYNTSSSASAFTAAMDGVYLFYELATPTTQAIEPPLNMSYRVEAGGTERVIVDTTQPAPQSAPPTLSTEYAYDMAHLRDAALSTVAPVENGKASTNYASGAYLVHQGVLCKVTSAIASGEAINPGTNATATTVMAELVALTS